MFINNFTKITTNKKNIDKIHNWDIKNNVFIQRKKAIMDKK